MVNDIQKAVARGLILEALAIDDDQSLSDVALESTMTGYGIVVSRVELRKELAYLSGKKLVEITVINRGLWTVRLTAEGTDFLETRKREPGIILSRA